jgi:RNA polymerase sigma-70 factor (ECF subfamily)
MDEDALIDRARAGDARAFEEIVRTYQRPVYGLAMRFLRDHDDADDVAQKTFLRAWDHLKEFEGRSQLKTWLLRICMNLCKNHHRDRRRFVDVDPESVEPTEDAVGAGRLEYEERLDRLREAVAALPEKQRKTVELRVYQSLSFKEIAIALDTTENASKVNFCYAVKTLKAKVGDVVAGALEAVTKTRET